MTVEERHCNNVMATCLAQMIKENPDLPVVPVVNKQVTQDGKYPWYLGKTRICSIDSYYIDVISGRLWLLADSDGELFEKYIDDHIEDLMNVDNATAVKIAEAYIKTLPWTRAIIVWVDV